MANRRRPLVAGACGITPVAAKESTAASPVVGSFASL
jgi:hypothetical protein